MPNGHGIASMVSWLYTTLRLPVKMVQTLLQQIYRLKLSVGEIVELTHAVAKAGQKTVTQIKTDILKQPYVHMDETGWREDGDNGYGPKTKATLPMPCASGYSGTPANCSSLCCSRVWHPTTISPSGLSVHSLLPARSVVAPALSTVLTLAWIYRPYLPPGPLRANWLSISAVPCSPIPLPRVYLKSELLHAASLLKQQKN